MPCSRATSDNRQWNTREEKDVPPATSNGGQVFYLNHLVADRDWTASFLEDCLPPVRVFVDHPQGSFVFGMQWKVTLRKEGSINWEIQAMSEECGWICSASRLPFQSETGRKRDATSRKRTHENCCQQKEFLLPSHADWGLHLQMVINIDYGLSCVDAYRPDVSVSLCGLWAAFLTPFSYTLMFQSYFLL